MATTYEPKSYGLNSISFTTAWRHHLDTPILKDKFCDRCQSEQHRMLVRNITVSGVSQVYWLCPVCNKNIKKPGSVGGFFISHYEIRKANIEIEKLPIINDYRENGIPCEVCGAPGAELHHYAPRHLFKDADSWATGFLCREHHTHWHNTVTPDMSKRR